METIKDIEIKIETLREKMHSLIHKNQYILTPEVLKASQNLDSILNEYYKLKNKKAS